MQNNSQSRRDRLDSKVKDEPVIKPDCCGLRAKIHFADDVIDSEIKEDVISGVVTDCIRLNVRKEPDLNAEVLAVIDLLSTIVVDFSASTGEFYKVTTDSGVEGFCLKKHIALPR